jgi:hypothetical protein
MSDLSLRRVPPAPPAQLTRAGAVYFDELDHILGFPALVVDTVVKSDYFLHELSRILAEHRDNTVVPQISPDDLIRTDHGIRSKALARHIQMLLEMVIVREVDNFQKYLVDLLREVLKMKPEILASSEKSISLEQVLKFDREHLLDDIIERKINDLSYEGFANVRSWCENRRIPLVIPEAESDWIVEYIATRNLISHNRCRVDDRYLRAVRTRRFFVGEIRTIDAYDPLNCAAALTIAVIETDAAVASKFDLEISPYRKAATDSEKDGSGMDPPDDDAPG